MYQQTQKDFHKNVLAKGLAIESHFPTSPSITTSLQKSPSQQLRTSRIPWYVLAFCCGAEPLPELMDLHLLKIKKYPNYYNLHNVSHQRLSWVSS